jgi:pimeloyl-ACP methyl ester carboxylesterase
MGPAVVLVAGFGAPTVTLRPLARTLRHAGYRVTVAPTGLNLDCGERTVGRLERVVEDFAVRTGGPAALVGHSRGGQLARVLAVRRPDLVDRLVTAGTPWTIGPPDRPGVATVARVLRRARALGVDLLPSLDCGHADCCTTFREDLHRKPTARWTALWSSMDRMAGADAAPPAEADESVDVGVSHLGLVTSHAGRGAVRMALGQRTTS